MKRALQKFRICSLLQRIEKASVVCFTLRKCSNEDHFKVLNIVAKCLVELIENKTNQLYWLIAELLRSFKSYLLKKMSSPSTPETISCAFSIYCVVRGDLTKYFAVQHHIQTLDIHTLVHEESTTKARDFTACDCVHQIWWKPKSATWSVSDVKESFYCHAHRNVVISPVFAQ